MPVSRAVHFILRECPSVSGELTETELMNCSLDYIFQILSFKIRTTEQTQKLFLASSVEPFGKVEFVFRDP